MTSRTRLDPAFGDERVAPASDASSSNDADDGAVTAVGEDAAAAPPVRVSASSYWSVVWQQLQKNTVSMTALWALVVLWALAIAAPVIASNVPLAWLRDGFVLPGGLVLPRLPLFERLFDRSLYPSGVDQFFNALLVLLPVWLIAPVLGRRDAPIAKALCLAGLVVWFLVFGVAALKARSALRVVFVIAVLGGTLRLLATRRGPRARTRVRWACLGLVIGALFTVSSPYRDEWPVENWIKRERVESVQSVFPPIPFHPDNVGDSEALERDTAGGSGRSGLIGYDANGRDVVARLLFGTRISLTIGFVSVSILVAIGVILGSLAGFYGGRVDLGISRFIEVMICFPTFFLLLTIIAVFESRSIFLIMLVIGIIGWTGVARLVRGEFIRQRSLDYVTAATALGLPQRRIIFRHVLPNCLGPVLVSATFGVASSILTESGLAFLGLGDVTVPSWGQMLTNGRASQEWHLILAPGFAIFVVVLIFNLIGEGLRDALDPKMRR